MAAGEMHMGAPHIGQQQRAPSLVMPLPIHTKPTLQVELVLSGSFP